MSVISLTSRVPFASADAVPHPHRPHISAALFRVCMLLGMVMYDNEFEPKTNEMYTKDTIEPQHVCENILLRLVCSFVKM